MTILKSLFSEYGLIWTINRTLYSAKLLMMKKIPITESLFEKNIIIRRINIFDFEVDSIAKFLKNRTNSEKKEIIKIADKALEGIITGFSSVELNFGNPINWHLNPITGYENDKSIKWYNIKDFDELVGDIKVIWEASRFTHVLYFARAYMLTEDIKYYEGFSNQIEDWLENNTYSYGSNYKCGQEATLRMTNILMAYAIFNSYGLIKPKDIIHIKKIIEGSYKKVTSNFFYAHKSIKNNHTFTEILGIIIGAWCSDSIKSLKHGYKLMDEEIKKQILPDGGYTQYSFNYHRFTLQILGCLFKVSKKTGYNITEIERIVNSALLLYQVSDKTGDIPNYGSNDGALIFPLSSCGYRDFSPVINTTYALFKGEKLFPYGPLEEELLWFADKTEFPLSVIQKKSSCFKNIGYYTLRSKDILLMITLQKFKSRPSHMDQLHIDLWHNGLNVLCDGGTFSYASELGSILSRTESHNVIKVDNVEQMNKKGAFFIYDWTEREEAYFDENTFKGKFYSKNNYSHERKVHLENDKIFIEDEVRASYSNYTTIFNTPCDVQVEDEQIFLYWRSEKVASISFQGELRVVEAKRSLYYLKDENINRILINHEILNDYTKNSFEITLF